jgi:hypothetical protein
VGFLSRATLGLLRLRPMATRQRAFAVIAIAVGAGLALPTSASASQQASAHMSARVTGSASAVSWHAKVMTLNAQRNAILIPASEHDGLQPRIGPCGGGNVNVYWDNSSVQPWGDIWDNCGPGTYVQIFVTYYTLGTRENPLAATAGPNSPSSHPHYWGPDFFNDPFPGNIYVTACEHYNGWHCGQSLKV